MFNCDVCGCCCRSIGKMVIGAIMAQDEADRLGIDSHPILDEIASFPFDINDDGACSMLNGDICSIYQNRPLICNTYKMYDKYWSKVMTDKEYYELSKKSCLKMQGRKNDIILPKMS